MAKDERAYNVRAAPSIPPAGYTGATWSDGDEMVYAIDALSDSLFKIDPEIGLATFAAPLRDVKLDSNPREENVHRCPSTPAAPVTQAMNAVKRCKRPPAIIPTVLTVYKLRERETL